MDIKWKDPQVRLRQNTVLGSESGSFGWYRNPLGTGSDTDTASP